MSVPYTIFLQMATAATFLAAAVAKSVDGASSESFLESARMPRVAVAASRLAVPIEALTGITLAAGVIIMLAGLTAVCLSATFCIVLLIGRWRGVKEACHCYGKLGGDDDTPLALLQAVLLLSASVVLVASYIQQGVVLANAPWRFPLAGVFGALTGLAVVAGFAMLEYVWSFERRRVRPARTAEE
mgnify:CR=1 FL=1